jgi:hypothetical protein
MGLPGFTMRTINFLCSLQSVLDVNKDASQRLLDQSSSRQPEQENQSKRSISRPSVP